MTPPLSAMHLVSCVVNWETNILRFFLFVVENNNKAERGFGLLAQVAKPSET